MDKISNIDSDESTIDRTTEGKNWNHCWAKLELFHLIKFKYMMTNSIAKVNC